MTVMPKTSSMSWLRALGPVASVTARSGRFPWRKSSACEPESAGWTRSQRDLTSERLNVAVRSAWSSTAGPDRRRLTTECVESALVGVGTPRWAALLAGSPSRLSAVWPAEKLGPRSDIDLVPAQRQDLDQDRHARR